jgi:hypothetical protein
MIHYPDTSTMAEGFSNGQDYTDLPPLDNRLVASAAATLDAAKIPHLLWGNYILTIFGIPTIVDVRTSCEYELIKSNNRPRVSILSLTIFPWTLPMTLSKMPVSILQV